MLQYAQPVWEHVLSLIGYFDLDPNRALDVILDVFSLHVTAHWSFFLALLSLSPWKGDSDGMFWDSEEEKKIEVKAIKGLYKDRTLDEVLRMAEGERSRALPNSGESLKPKVMAQVLGFKFRHYQVKRNFLNTH
jgi:THO complex subunit 2